MGARKAKKQKVTRKVPSSRRAVRGEKKADARLVERTIELLVEHDRVVGVSVRRVGAFILEEYFDGDVELARSNDPFKVKSYARLVERAVEETSWDAADFRRAVVAEVVARSLPTAIANAILPTYLERLGAIDDPSRRVAVATRIARGELSGQEAKDLITKESGENPRGGRTRMPGAQKAIGVIERVVDRAREAGDLAAKEVDRVPESAREGLALRVEGIVDALQDLRSRLLR